MLASDALGVNALSREMAHSILHGRGSWFPVPNWYRALAAASIPERFRGEFSLAYGEREKRAAATAQSWLPQITGVFRRHCDLWDHTRKRRAASLTAA